MAQSSLRPLGAFLVDVDGGFLSLSGLASTGVDCTGSAGVLVDRADRWRGGFPGARDVRGGLSGGSHFSQPWPDQCCTDDTGNRAVPASGWRM
jgi:hypothetical protein